ncbi:MAG: apolipoprotein N-acyltransferase, partial [Candidatus Zixiibacteriota bacterium]
ELTLWAFVLSLAYYPWGLGFLAWFSIVRPAMIIASLEGRRAFAAAYLYGFCFTLFTIYWIWIVTPPGAITAIIIVAFYYAGMLMIFNRLYRQKPLLGFIALPVLWVGLEYIRTLSEFAFPWSDLGYTQTDYLYVLQIVSVISVHGLSFLIVAVNVLLWQVFRKQLSPERRLTSAFLSIAVVVVVTAFGWIVIPSYPTEGDFKVAILQGSVPISVKWEQDNQEHSFNLYDSLTQSVDDTTVQLFIWPETSAPSYLSHSPADRQRIGNIVRRSGGYHLVGALGATRVGESYDYHNSCYQFSPNGVMGQRYDKVKLVPFSEQVPYQDRLPFLKKEVLTEYLTFIETYDVQWWSDFRPGDSILLFELPEASYGVAICFESTFPEYSREMIRKGAHFLVSITNDTWFGHSVGVYMHSRIMLTRAVENRCWTARAANSGISYVVDGYGRIRHQLGLDDVATLTAKVELLDEYSIFTRHGDVVGYVCFLLTLPLIHILPLIWLVKRIRAR